MRKSLFVLLSVSALVVSGSFIASATTEDSKTVVKAGGEETAPAPCQSKQTTALVKAACNKGGQPSAKKAMKTWVKKVKTAKKAAGEEGFKLTCKSCHTSLKGAYPLKADGLQQFTNLDKWLKTQK